MSMDIYIYGVKFKVILVPVIRYLQLIHYCSKCFLKGIIFPGQCLGFVPVIFRAVENWKIDQKFGAVHILQLNLNKSTSIRVYVIILYLASSYCINATFYIKYFLFLNVKKPFFLLMGKVYCSPDEEVLD